MAVGLTDQTSSLLPVEGIRLGSIATGNKKNNRHDLLIIEISEHSECAAMFTQNAFCAAPVILSRQHLRACSPRYLLINSGCANAGTGEPGIKDAVECCYAVSELAACQVEHVLPFSTGVIGERLPVDLIKSHIKPVFEQLNESNWAAAARAIMTTDTIAKGVSKQINIGNETITITGICKGSGMIHPNMATMLAFITTDAKVEPELLQQCLFHAVKSSFNSITVDGDTSTNDACILIATGKRSLLINNSNEEAYLEFCAAVSDVCVDLAKMIIRDGEGATKFITIDVHEGANVEECRQVAYTIAHSPLVKTAFFACDPNWGRILAAIGRAGLDYFDIEGVSIYLDEVCIVRRGARASDYQEQQGREVLKRDDVTVRVLLGRGSQRIRIWTCDFSYDYVRINAEYRT